MHEDTEVEMRKKRINQLSVQAKSSEFETDLIYKASTRRNI